MSKKDLLQRINSKAYKTQLESNKREAHLCKLCRLNETIQIRVKKENTRQFFRLNKTIQITVNKENTRCLFTIQKDRKVKNKKSTMWQLKANYRIKSLEIKLFIKVKHK